MFRRYNANPLGNDTADCTVRAISTAQGKTWDETYRELSELAQKQGVLLDNVEFIEDYLDSRYLRRCYNSLTVGEFLEECPKGVFLVTMKSHISCIKDKVLIDTFDCRDRVLWCAWEVK